MHVETSSRSATVFWFKKIFDYKYSTLFCLIVAIISKSVVAWTYTDFEADKSLYLLLAKGFLETGVFAEKVRFIGNGNLTFLYNSAIVSPLYSLLCVPFLWLTRSYLVTQLVITIIGWSLFFTGLVKVAGLILGERRLVNMFVLFTSFFLYPHELASTPKDTLAAGLVLWSIFFIYQISRNKISVINAMLCGLSLACLCLSKLLYLPAAFLLILLLSIISIKNKSKPIIIQLGIALGFLSLVLGCAELLVIQPASRLMHIAGNINPIFLKGIYPKNLLQTFPFISSSIIDTNFFGVQISKGLSVTYNSVIRVFQVIDLIVLIILAGYSFFIRRLTITGRVIEMLIAVALIMAGVTIFLSLRFQEFHFTNDDSGWTYVADSRSFLVPMILLQLLVFILVFQITSAFPLRWLLIVLLFINLVHGIYFTGKQFFHLNQEAGYAQATSPVKTVVATLVQLKQYNRDFSLVTSDEILRRYAEIIGLKPYALTGQSSSLSSTTSGRNFLIATMLSDSSLRNNVGIHDVKPIDTIKPFVLQVYPAK